MKKFLLLLMLLCATSYYVSAQEDVSITPSRYDFANQNVGTYKVDTFVTGANITAPCDEVVKKYYNNGLFIVAGGQFGNSKMPYAKDLQAGTSVVDLGGEVGKVLCINGKNSKFNTNNNVEFPQCTGNLNWFNLNFFSDPNNTPIDGTAEKPNIRVRIVLNIFSNSPSEANNAINSVYTVTNQGNVIPKDGNKADGIAITTGEFVETYEDGTPVEDDNGDYVYDPTKWMVYEFDTYAPEPDQEDPTKVSTPLRIKMEMNQGNLVGSTLFIKEISFTKLSNNESPILGTRKKSYLTLKSNPTNIKDVLSQKTGLPKVYTLSGIQVTSGKKLPQGVYILNQGKNTKKIIVK